LNQITRTDSTRLTYDDNGNLTDDGTLLLEYDPFNRLKRVKNKSNSQTVGEYTYDAAGRRIRKVITNGGIIGTLPNGTTDYLYDQNQCVEERDGSNSHTKQFIWGIYIDELIQQKTYATTGGGGLAAGEYYPLQDPHYRVMALTDDGGDIVEAYDYDPYGKRQVFSAAGTDAIWFTNDDTIADDASCQYGHQGLLHDEETGLVYNRARMLHPILGRFLQRDLTQKNGEITADSGYRDGMNLYQYVRSLPTVHIDPLGLAGMPIYGCYCGTDNNCPPAPGGGPPEPIDDVDKACQNHDKCYGALGLSGFSNRNKNCGQRDCDRQLVNDMDDIIYNPLKHKVKGSGPTGGQWAAKKIYGFFRDACDPPCDWEEKHCSQPKVTCVGSD
jgi:RHS repeat-associated protein